LTSVVADHVSVFPQTYCVVTYGSLAKVFDLSLNAPIIVAATGPDGYVNDGNDGPSHLTLSVCFHDIHVQAVMLRGWWGSRYAVRLIRKGDV